MIDEQSSEESACLIVVLPWMRGLYMGDIKFFLWMMSVLQFNEKLIDFDF